MGYRFNRGTSQVSTPGRANGRQGARKKDKGCGTRHGDTRAHSRFYCECSKLTHSQPAARVPREDMDLDEETKSADVGETMTTNGGDGDQEYSVVGDEDFESSSDFDRYYVSEKSDDDEWSSTLWRNVEDDDGIAGAEGGARNVPASMNQEDVRPYLDQLATQSNLHLLRPKAVEKACDEQCEYGLFTLFFTKTFNQTIIFWTNPTMKTKGKDEISMTEFDAYLGLELLMSIIRLNEIADYCSESPYLGVPSFRETMPRSRFQDIRGALRFSPNAEPTPTEKRIDPLWHCRNLLNHVQTKFKEIAVSVGVSSLGECSVRTKARTKALSYIPKKPDKYAIRFYVIVGWSSLYVHTLVDNGSGSSFALSPAERYIQLFPALRDNLLRLNGVRYLPFDISLASSLWVAMAGHQTKMLKSAGVQKRLIVCDNFYTRHVLAKALAIFTDGDIRNLGTVRLNLVARWNKVNLEKSEERVEKMSRGSWELVAAVDPTKGWKVREKQHKKKQDKLPKAKKCQYIGPVTIAPRAGYVVFKDSKTVIFYTNDLAATMTKNVLKSNSNEAARCVYGLHPINCWTGTESMHRSTFNVPTFIAGYNKFMNADDRADQLRSTNPTRRKESRLPMAFFTWSLDMRLNNAFALLRHLKPGEATTLRDFKIKVIDTLIAPAKEKRQMIRRKTKRPSQSNEVVIGANLENHVLTENANKARLSCRLCSMRGIKLKVSTGCTDCQLGFHVNCFAVFHRPHGMEPENDSVKDALRIVALELTGTSAYKTRKRLNKSITPLKSVTLPTTTSDDSSSDAS